MVMPRTSSGSAEQSTPAEDQQQREAGHRGRQHDRQVDDGLEPALAAELPARQHDRERQSEVDGHDQAHGGRDQAQRERVEHDRRGDRDRRVEPSRRARTTSVTTGSARKIAKSAATATSELAYRPAGVRHHANARPSPCPPNASRLLDHDGGRNPKRFRIAWPVGPGEPVEERHAQRRVRGCLDHDAGVAGPDIRGAGTSTISTPRCHRVGDVDDRRVAFAELDLRDHRLDVVLSGHDVGGVGGNEVGRIAARRQVLDELGRVLGDRHLVACRDDMDPGPARSAGEVMPAGLSAGTMIVSSLPAKIDRVAIGQAGSRRASAGWPYRPTGRRRPGRPARSASRARPRNRSRA